MNIFSLKSMLCQNIKFYDQTKINVYFTELLLITIVKIQKSFFILQYHKNGYRNYSNLPVNFPYSSCEKGVHIKKGQEIGRFEMGSTVVMIFESTSIDWNIKAQQKVYFGQQIASY